MTKYYTTSEVANICNVHRNTIIGAIRKGLLKIHRTPGGHARISQEDLDDFCHRRSMPTTSLIVRNNRVLILDPDAPFVSVLSKGLQELDYQVEAAREPFMAGYLLGRFQPNVVLLETGIGDTPGHAICRAIRSLPKLRDTAVIGVSDSKDQTVIDALVESGIDDFLAKPFELDTLLTRIVNLIGPVVQGTAGRATTGKVSGKVTRIVQPTTGEVDGEQVLDPEEDIRETRKARVKDTKSRTTFGGVLAGKDEDDEDFSLEA